MSNLQLLQFTPHSIRSALVNTEEVDFATIISLKFGTYQVSSAPASSGKKKAAFEFCGSDEEDGTGAGTGAAPPSRTVYKRPIMRENKRVKREHK